VPVLVDDLDAVVAGQLAAQDSSGGERASLLEGAVDGFLSVGEPDALLVESLKFVIQIEEIEAHLAKYNGYQGDRQPSD
ncbi:MAG: hypothetical protein ABW128_08320, partial [Rhizorhabdus sp.]